MFHHLFSWMNSISFWGYMGQVAGWAILCLPSIVVSLRRGQSLRIACLVNLVALFLMDTSAWMATKAVAQPWVLAVYICAAVCWLVALVLAIVSKRSTLRDSE